MCQFSSSPTSTTGVHARARARVRVVVVFCPGGHHPGSAPGVVEFPKVEREPRGQGD